MKISLTAILGAVLALVLAIAAPPPLYATTLSALTNYDLSGIGGEIRIEGSAQTQPWLLLSNANGIQKRFWIVHVENNVRLESLDTGLIGINPDEVLQAAAVGDKVAFLTPTQAVVFDPLTRKSHKYELPYSANNPWLAWSEKYDRLIWGTELLPSSATSRPHAVQTGLALLADESGFVTSGYHDHSIRFWSTSNGELLRELELSGWFWSHKITGMVALQQGVLFSTQREEIYGLPAGSEKKTSSLRPCPDDVQLLSLQGSEQQSGFYRCAAQGGYGLVLFATSGDKVATIPLSESDGDSVLSAHQIGANVLVIRRSGDLELFDVASGNKVQQLQLEGAADIVLLPKLGKIARLGESRSLELFVLPETLTPSKATR